MTVPEATIPITATVAEFERLTGISKRSAWRLIHARQVESVMICGRRLIVMDSYRALIERQLCQSMPKAVGEDMGDGA